MWKRHAVGLSPRPRGLARQGLCVEASWREARPRLASGILAFLGSLCLVGGASGAGGDLGWEDHVDKVGGADGVSALAVGSGQVFAAGSDTNAAGHRDFLVRAYQAKTGAQLWEDQVDKAGFDDAAVAVAAGGGQVVAGGVGTKAAGNFDVLIRAYEVK
jgi:hypothetical protein